MFWWVGDPPYGLGLDSPENISRVEKLKACGAADEDIIKVIEEGTPSSTYMQKKIFELDDFNYLDDNKNWPLRVPLMMAE